ncbi:MAG: hypothetical protein KJ714_04190 [Euryarchaeota archaeon]|nr:hypothetical protein [Euryarchaeota archaeon]
MKVSSKREGYASHTPTLRKPKFRFIYDKLTDEELNYLVELILKGDEDVRSLAEGDFDALVEVIEKRLPEKAKELTNKKNKNIQ